MGSLALYTSLGRLSLVAALVWLPVGPFAYAEDPAPVATVAEAPDEDEIPIATVLEDRLDVKIDGSGKLVEKRTWKVRIEDPARCRAGLVAPDGLDGAKDGVAQVFERLLVPPDTTPAGAVFTLVGSRTRTGVAHSGVFETAPDLPVVAASVTITSAQPNLTVWSDTRGHASFSRTGGRTATISWEGLDVGMAGQVVWTTNKDWLSAGDRMEGALKGKLASIREDLGRTLATDIQSTSVAAAAEKVYQAVQYEEGRDERWEASRKLEQILADKKGSAVDRGVVLISLLRVAGFDARPALYRPASESGAVPLSVPAPALVSKPAVAVYMSGRTVWIDPASDRVAIPDMPGSMIGGVAWVAGDSPFQLPNPGVVDGIVNVDVQMNAAPDGGATFTATISASKVGAEALRSLLGVLPLAERESATRRLVTVSSPSLDRFGFDAQGLDDPYRPLMVTIQGHIPTAFAPFGGGLQGNVHPLIAPALAAWLPPRILVAENMAVTPPIGLQAVATTPIDGVWHPDVLLSRKLSRQGGKFSLVSSAERPYRTMSPAREAEAERFLHDAATVGSTVLLLPPPTPDVVKSIRGAQGKTPAEVAILEALLWWTNNGKPVKAEKAFRRALLVTPAGEVAPIIQSLSSPDEPRAWKALYTFGRDDRERVQAIEGLAKQGSLRDAWVLANDLSAIGDPPSRVQSLVWRVRLQGLAADPSDRAAVEMWRSPAELLAEAKAVGGDDQPDVLIASAKQSIAAGNDGEAEVLLEHALAAGPNPKASILLADVGARTGIAVEEVVERVLAATSAAPSDPEVIAGAAHALAGVKKYDLALQYGLSAARIADGDAAAWFAVVKYAIDAGDLSVALYSARKASDLAPGEHAYGEQLALVATLAMDHEAALLGGARGGAVPNVKWPPTVDALIGIAPDDMLLALLQYHDADVIASPQNLSLRAQLRLDAGLLDGAARDGALLAGRHKNARGAAIAFAATAGRLWSSAQVEALDDAAKSDPVAYSVRMEYRLIGGSGDAAADAKAQKGDPRAQIVIKAATTPDVLAAEVAGWQANVPDPAVKAPNASFKPNKILGGAKGVVAFSDAERGRTIIASAVSTGNLPPPLALMYTPAEPLLRRLSGGGQLMRLDGGPIPVYAAVRLVDGIEYTAVAFTPEAALDALLLAVP